MGFEFPNPNFPQQMGGCNGKPICSENDFIIKLASIQHFGMKFDMEKLLWTNLGLELNSRGFQGRHSYHKVPYSTNPDHRELDQVGLE